MKAQRRHDLKTNALARGLEGFPSRWREYGNQALLVVLVGLIAFLAIRYWNEKKQSQARAVVEAQQTIQSSLQQLNDQPRFYSREFSEQLMDQRQRLERAAEAAISTVLDTAKDPKALAAAWVAKGDLEWKLANMPLLPGAETQPSLEIKDRDKLLSDARVAYLNVLQPPYSSDPFDVFSARVGLAAIAEDQKQWETARQQYQAIIESPSLPEAFKDYARARLTELPQYEKPPLIGQPPPPTEEPATIPTTTEPTFGPFLSPSTQPQTQPATGAAASQSAPGPGSQPPPTLSQPATTQIVP